MFHSIFGCFSAKISYQKNTNILGIPDPPPLIKKFILNFAMFLVLPLIDYNVHHRSTAEKDKKN